MFGRIILGLVGIAIGTLMVMKTESLVSSFGPIYFFDKYLGSEGGTRLGYKLIGLFIIFISMLIATNMIDGFLMWILGPLINRQKPV